MLSLLAVSVLVMSMGTGHAQTRVVPDQSNFIQPTHELVTEGIPQIPSAIAPLIDRYTSLYGLPLAGWSPVAHEVLLKGLSSVAWVMKIEAPEREPVLQTYLQFPGVYDIYYQPRGQNFVYNKDTNGSEDFQLYYYDHLTHASTLLTQGKARNTEPVWSNAGDRIIYSSAAPNQEGVSLYVMSPTRPQSNRPLVASAGGYLKAYDWSPDDRHAAYCDFAAVYASTLWLVDVTTGTRTLLTPRPEGAAAGYFDNPRFSKDGAGLYVITDHESDTHRLAYLDLATKRFKYLSSHVKWDVTEFEVAPDGRTVAILTNEDGISRLRLLDAATGAEKSAPRMPVGVISDLKWSRNSEDLAFNFKSPRTPNDVFSLNAPTGTLVRWAGSVTKGIDTATLPEPKLIRWKSFDGRMISGFCYRPHGAFKGKRPVVIDLHGGPEMQHSPVYGYEDNYYLNELGVVKIYPNVRGSTGYGRTFRQLDDGLRREDAVKDIGALLDWIKAQPDLDAERVMVQGASYGGYLALAAGAAYNDRVRAVLSDSGPTNLVSFIESTEGWRRQLQRTEFGDERKPELRSFLERVAPLSQAHKLRKPMMIIQGQNDPRVKTSESEQLVRAVRKNGTPVWYLLAKNEGHGFVHQSNRNYRLYSVALFVQTYLLN
jgi:dipeptidyl aminopeptidase/acylaminoacyl peptidase